MEITRNVILDLLPLYLADEASAETRKLVEEYLETDPELASIAKRSAAVGLPRDIPVPLSRDDKMEAYKVAKRHLFRRIIILAIVMAFALSTCLVVTTLWVMFISPQ
jgi:hypothetical protein